MSKKKVYVVTEDIPSEQGAIVAIVSNINNCKKAMINYVKNFYNKDIIKEVVDFNFVLDEDYKEENKKGLDVYLADIRVSRENNPDEDIFEEFIVFETYIDSMFFDDKDLSK